MQIIRDIYLPQRVGPTYCQFDARVERDSEIICASF
jgi:hypothetical protein